MCGRQQDWRRFDEVSGHPLNDIYLLPLTYRARRNYRAGAIDRSINGRCHEG
jgi:hypothetical protein